MPRERRAATQANAAMYVGYADDDESPASIMAKFAALEEAKDGKKHAGNSGEDVELSEEELMVRDVARDYCQDQLMPRVLEAHRHEQFDRSIISEMGELGLLGPTIPEAYGGAGLSFSAYLACVREISKACAATGIIWATNFHAMKPVIDFGTEELDSTYEPHQAAVDEVIRDLGYEHGEKWQTRKFEGAGHQEQAWQERAHIPLKFLLGNNKE